jgi:DNA/RNA endonuclease G (NUC1)
VSARLPQERAHGRGAIRSAPAQRRVGEVSEHRTARHAQTGGLSVDLAEKVLWDRDHHLRHRFQYTVVYDRRKGYAEATLANTANSELARIEESE